MRKFYLSSIVLFFVVAVQAQSITNYSFSASAGTFTPVTGGTPIATTTSVADFLGDTKTSVALPIGFTFYYMGTAYTTVKAASDGFITFNPSGTSSATNNLATSTQRPLAAPLWDDLDGASGSGAANYITTGAPGSRVFTVEWLNWQWNYLATGSTISFQVHLYEATGAIEFVYRQESGAVNSASASIGLSGPATGSGNYLSLSGSGAAPTVSSAAETTNISTKPATGQTYTFTPLYNTTPTAPSSINFTATTVSSVQVNWTDNSSNETFFTIYVSTDGITYTPLATQASATTAGTGSTHSYTATGLTPNTTYFFRVVAGNEASAPSAGLDGSTTTSAGTLSGIKTVGTGGDYTNLTTAFADIRANGLAGNITLQLIAGYPATPETYPILSSNYIVGAFSVTVYPTVAGLSITSANATGTLLLDNATNITFDGRINATGTTKSLVIENTATAGYAIRFVNDAVNNTVKYADIKGVATGTTNGVITFGSTTGSIGNDNNTIDNVDIHEGVTLPANGIYASGSSTLTNDNNTVSNSNIYNFFAPGTNANGILLSTGSNAWTITGNHFYQTAPRTTTSGNTYSAISISNSTSGNNFTVSNNFIGGAAPNALGAAWTFTNNTFGNRFTGISLSAGSTTPSNITGNTIKNVLLNTNSSATGNFLGISGTAGAMNILNNNIGDQTSTAIAVSLATNTGGIANLISYTGSGIVNISSNVLGGVYATSAAATVGQSINGIYVTGGTPTISNNTIGGTAVNSIEAFTVVTGTVLQYVMGIQVTSATTSATITGNLVRNLNQSGTTTSTSAGVRGISYAGSATATISNNIVTDLSGANGNSSMSGAAASVIGILHTGSATGGATISGNRVNTLRATNTGAVQTNVVGIGYSNPTGGTVTQNRIYDLRNASTMTTATTPPTAIGILLRASVGTAPVIANNMISLGDAQSTNTEFVGIMNNFTTFGYNIYHNTVVISGTAASGALPSFAMLRGDNSGTAITTPLNIKNNIFINTRTGGTGKHYAIANQSTAANAAGFVSNYNILNGGTTATVGLWGSTDLTFSAWKATTLQDLNSYSNQPVTFINIPTADLHLTMTTATRVESGGVAGLGVSDDYDLQIRATYPGYAGTGTAPDMGADEFEGIPQAGCSSAPTAGVITGSNDVCTGSSRNLALSGHTEDLGISYQWQSSTTSGGTFTNIAGATSVAYNTGALTSNIYYKVIVTCTNTAESVTTPEFAVLVNPLPVVTAVAASPTICSGTSTTLTASGASTYTWSPATGLSATTGSVVTTTTTVNRTYTVTGTDANGCMNTANVSITVNPAVTATASATPTVICSNANSQLNSTIGSRNYSVAPIAHSPLTPSGTATVLVENGAAVVPTSSGDIEDGRWANIALPFTFNFYGTDYTTINITTNGTAYFGTATTSTGYNVVLPATGTPNNAIHILTSDMDFRNPTAGTSTGKIEYFEEGTAPNRKFVISYSNVPFYNQSLATPPAGTVTVQAILYEGTNAVEIHTSSSTNTTTNKAQGVEDPTGTVATVTPGRNNVATLTGLPDAYKFTLNPITYSWSPATFLNDATLPNPLASNMTASTTYTVTITDAVTGCFGTATASVTVGAPLVANASANTNTPCIGSSVVLTAAPTGGGVPYSYSWSDGASVVSTNQTFTATVNSNVTYTVTVTDMCGNSVSDAEVLTVNNPAITGTTPGSRCGVGTVTLGATGAAGTTLYWYSAATGGAALGSGTTFTTPSINTTTPFFVGAAEVGTQQTGGRTAPASTTSTTASTYGLVFNLDQKIILETVDVYPAGSAGNVVIQLQNSSGAMLQSATVAIPAGTGVAPFALPLNFEIPQGTGYRLVAISSPSMVRESGLGGFPYALGTAGSITSGYISGTSTNYYYFYNWKFKTICEGTRSSVLATVTTPPAISITGTAAICKGQSTTLTVSSANTGYTYSWSPGGMTTASVTVTPLTTTKYYVTATDASGGASNGCVTVDSITVTVNAIPTIPAITASANPICNGQMAQLDAYTYTGHPTIRITEATQFRTGDGQTPTYPSWVGAGDDLVEISNLANTAVNLTGLVLEVWEAALNRSWTIPAGTIIPANGVMVVHLGTGTNDPSNLFFNTGGTSNSLSSGDDVGYVLKSNGSIVDALGTNSYVWPVASGVTAADWSGNIPSSSGDAGVIRTAAADGNVAADWVVSTALVPQSIGTYNGGYTALTPTSFTYSWTPAIGLSNTTIADPIATPTTSQTYTLVVTETVTGCTNTGNITITVNQLPAITTHPRDTIFCAGGNATFTVAATGDGLTYQWRKNGVNIPGATAATYLVNNATPADSGSYTVVVTGTCSPAVTSNVAVLALYGQPTIIADPTAQTACVGSAATFTVTATAEAITYQWRKDGLAIPGATSASYTIPSVVMGDAGNYDVIVSGTCSPAVTSAAVALTVNPAPSITGEPTSVTTCEGTAASFTVTATGPGLAYQWRKNGVNIAGANAATYSIPAVAAADGGSYDVIVSGTCTPSDTSNAATLTVQILPVITTQPQTQTVCAGQNATFTVVAAGTGLSYQWKKNGTDIPGATAASFTITSAVAADAGSYTVVVSGTCAPSVTSNAAVLTVDQAPVIGTQPASQTVCSGSNVTFSVSATGVGLTYQWYRNNTIAISGATSNTYTITGATAGSAGQYHVVVNSSCGTTVTSAVATLIVNTPPAITVQPASQTACLASTVNFTVTATGTSLTYQWKKNGVDISGATSSTLSISNVSAADLGSYTVVVSGICGTPVTSSAATLAVSATNTWLGVANSDWNNAANWCAGVPTSTSVILIPSGTPFAAILLGNGNVKDLTVGTGATLTIGASGALNVYGNIVNSGTVAATAGTILFMGTTPQAIPALTVGHVVMNGTGGVTLGGTLTINNSLTLTNGHITLGNNNLIMTGGSVGTLASHIITNGTGVVTGNNVGTASVVFPVGPDAASYNPVLIANGGGRNYSVGVATGINPAIFNAARAINRTWNVSVNTAPAAAASITFGYADAHANASATPTANMEVGRHNGTSWLVITPAGGVAPFGVASLRTVTTQSTAFGPMVVANAGGILNPTSLPNVDADITSAVLMPNVFEYSTILRMNVRRSMKIDWTIMDARGRVVMTFKRDVLAGQSDIHLMLGHLANGTYFLSGETEKGKTEVLRFIKL